MINNEEFTKRLSKVINYYGESASSFAEKIGGKGEFPITTNNPIVKKEEHITPISQTKLELNSKIETNSNSNKSIERIVIFYSDGSFENYKN